uniref:Uncharacterized protein n=1 Tax=viral metagenome TaxID=1070528 RepID=A0A6C0JWW3_9ZZZZ
MQLNEAYILAKQKVDQLEKETKIFNMVNCYAPDYFTDEYNKWTIALINLTSRMMTEAPFDLKTKTKIRYPKSVIFQCIVLQDEATAIQVMNAVNEKEANCCFNDLFVVQGPKRIVYFRRLSHMKVQTLLLSLDPSIQSLLPKKKYE